MKSLHRLFWIVALALVAAFALTRSACAATVTATLDPQEISVGDSAQLTVTVSGGQGQLNVPPVDGLDINGVSQSTQTEWINGAFSSTSSIIYQVTPQRDGTFTIPAIQIGGAASQPLTLHVLKNASVNPAPAQTLPAPSLPTAPANSGGGPVVMPQANAAPTSVAPGDRFGSIQITLPKKEVYLGELVPVDIEVFIPDDVQGTISELPTFTSDGFTLNSLGTKPEQTQQVANGRAYSVFIWHSALTGVKAGEYPCTFKMPLTVIVPQQMPQDADPGDMFNNFFRNAMAAMGTRKEVSIGSPTITLKVLPLPQDNRPADFTGAVGEFEIESSATPLSVNAGDPITLRLKISGSGNFDRVATNLLPSDAHWKTYSTKSTFEPSDSVGFSGAKTFEQPIIPNDSSVTAVPPVTFSYFNPETRQYVTRTAAPIAVAVGGSAAAPVAPPVAASTPPKSTPPPPSPTPAPSTDLRANQIEAGSFVSTLQPVYLNPWFVAGQGVPLLGLLGGLAFVRFHKQVTHPARLRATAIQLAIRQHIDAMDAAMRNQQTDVFFIHARSALQQRLGHEWKMSPDAITLADVEARLDSGIETVRPVFEMADQAKYSDLHFEESDLQQWRDAVVNQLAEKN